MTATANDPENATRPARGLVALLDFAVAAHWRAIALLVALSLLAFVPGIFRIPPLDRDEARLAQTTKQMIETGNYADIRFMEEAGTQRPPAVHWLQAAAVNSATALGVAQAEKKIWLYRLPSLAGAIGAVLLTYWAALAFVNRRAALIAGVTMAGSVVMSFEARLADPGTLLLCAVVAAMGAMARVYLRQRRVPDVKPDWEFPAIFWTALAAGMLIHGALIFIVVGLTAAAISIVDRSARWITGLRPLFGVAWLLLLVLPWLLTLANTVGAYAILESLSRDFSLIAITGRDTHRAPPGYHFLSFWLLFWPGSILAGLAAPAVWNARHEPGARFLLAWLIPSWAVFEAILTKLPNYVVPLYPAVAILAAGILVQGGFSRKPWLSASTMGWFIFPTVIAVTGIVAKIAIAGDLGIGAWPFAAAAAVAGLFAWRLYDVDGAERSLLRATVASLLVGVMMLGVVIPSLPTLFPSTMLANEIRKSGCARPVAAAAGYFEPSLFFLLGTETRHTDGAGAAEFLRGGPCRFAILEGRSERSFVQRAQAIGLLYASAGRVDAVNFNMGHSLSISIFRSETGP